MELSHPALLRKKDAKIGKRETLAYGYGNGRIGKYGKRLCKPIKSVVFIRKVECCQNKPNKSTYESLPTMSQPIVKVALVAGATGGIGREGDLEQYEVCAQSQS